VSQLFLNLLTCALRTLSRILKDVDALGVGNHNKKPFVNTRCKPKPLFKRGDLHRTLKVGRTFLKMTSVGGVNEEKKAAHLIVDMGSGLIGLLKGCVGS
jgi:hypothetical protein